MVFQDIQSIRCDLCGSRLRQFYFLAEKAKRVQPKKRQPSDLIPNSTSTIPISQVHAGASDETSCFSFGRTISSSKDLSKIRKDR